MAYKKVKLGDYLLGYDEINKDGEFSEVDDLQGINNEKYFQGCQSNKNDIDLSRYRICRHGMFAYNKATSRNGEKISIAYRTDGDCLISPSYICFSIKDENVLMPEYLMLWFKRPVFDRYARFNSWGSATEFFTWEDFKEIEFDLPSIEEQQKIVRQYKTITDRIEVLEKINEELTKLAKIAIEEGLQEDVTDVLISEFCKDTSSGGTPSRSHSEYYGGSINWLKSGEVHNNIVVEVEEQITQKGLEKSSAKLFPKDTVLMAMYGVTAGQVGYLNVESTTNQAICAMLCKNEYDSAFLYFSLLIKQEEFERQATGGAQQNLSQDIIKNNTIKISHKYRDLHCDVFMGNIIYNSIEIAKLNRIKESIAQRL